MKSQKRKMLDYLMSCDADLIQKSLNNPNQYMTKFDLIIHKIALRRKGIEL